MTPRPTLLRRVSFYAADINRRFVFLDAKAVVNAVMLRRELGLAVPEPLPDSLLEAFPGAGL